MDPARWYTHTYPHIDSLGNVKQGKIDENWVQLLSIPFYFFRDTVPIFICDRHERSPMMAFSVMPTHSSSGATSNAVSGN